VALPEANQTPGAYLRTQRLAAGLTQAQLAARAGVARPNVAAIEAGRRPASTDMANRLLDAIRGRPPGRRTLELSPPVLLNIELARAAANHVARDPGKARTAMTDRLAQLRSHDAGSSATWLDDWDGILSRWDLSEVMALLISTDPDDVERRKVSPLDAVISPPEREQAARQAREIWRAARRVS
ncbi:MAG: helix-turn-helix domain-containing protein, partial [Sciscionella sp.]